MRHNLEARRRNELLKTERRTELSRRNLKQEEHVSSGGGAKVERAEWVEPIKQSSKEDQTKGEHKQGQGSASARKKKLCFEKLCINLKKLLIKI